MTRVITVASGKGGVGKTNISVNLALHLAEQGYKTCLFDADLGLANVNILLGLYPDYNLEDVISGDKDLRDIIIRDYNGIDIIPGSSGVEKIANLEPDQIKQLIKSFTELDAYDFFIFDTGAGVSKNVVPFCMASSEVILVINQEPTSLTDAYALLKILTLNGYHDTVRVIVNQSTNIKIARVAYTKLKETVQKFLSAKLLPLGVVVQDSFVLEAVKQQTPFMLLYPNSKASKCIKNIFKQLITRKNQDIETFDIETFWTRYLEVLKSPIKFPGRKDDTTAENITQTLNDEKPKKQKKESLFPEKQRAVSADTVVSNVSEHHPLIPESFNIENFAERIHLSLERLVNGVSSLSHELGAIRKIIENKNDYHPDVAASDEKGGEKGDAMISLDFEKFKKRRQMGM